VHPSEIRFAVHQGRGDAKDHPQQLEGACSAERSLLPAAMREVGLARFAEHEVDGGIADEVAGDCEGSKDLGTNSLEVAFAAHYGAIDFSAGQKMGNEANTNAHSSSEEKERCDKKCFLVTAAPIKTTPLCRVNICRVVRVLGRKAFGKEVLPVSLKHTHR
jgi:hypothetical protein